MFCASWRLRFYGIEKPEWNAFINPSDVTMGFLQLRVFRNSASSLLQISNSNNISSSNLDINNSVRDQSLFLIDDDDNQFKLTFTNAPTAFQMYVGDLPMDKHMIYEMEL